MGWSYSHLALFGPQQKEVIAALKERKSILSPTINGFTLVADEEFISHDESDITRYCTRLSQTLQCHALILSEYDDNVLSYKLIDKGRLIDEYNSEPDYFDFSGTHNPPRGPEGGNAGLLCGSFGRQAAQATVHSILKNEQLRSRAPERHRQLAEALGMPGFSVGFDYEALQVDELPEGLNKSDLVFTAPQ